MWEKLQETLDLVQEKIDTDLYDEWVENPCTQSLMLQIQMKVYEKEEYLSEASYIDEEHGLTKAAQAQGAKKALQDLLDIEYSEE